MAAFTSIATGNWSSTDTWRATDAWTAATEYAANAFVKPTTPNGYVYEVTAGGGGNSHADTEPVWPTTIDDTIGDGDLTWTCRAGSPGQVAGDTVTIGDGTTASQNITLGADPANSLASITNSARRRWNRFSIQDMVTPPFRQIL